MHIKSVTGQNKNNQQPLPLLPPQHPVFQHPSIQVIVAFTIENEIQNAVSLKITITEKTKL